MSAQKAEKLTQAASNGETSQDTEKVTEKSALFYDFLEMVRGKKFCHLTEYAYGHGENTGDELDGVTHFERVAQNPEYPGNKELSFLRATLPEITQYLPDTMSILEIGPGSVYTDVNGEEVMSVGAQKTEAFIDAIQEAPVTDLKRKKKSDKKSITQHFSLDVDEGSAQNGSTFISENYGINSRHIVTDYRALAEAIKQDPEKRPLYATEKTTPVIFCFGNTPFNLVKVPGNRVGSEMANCLADIGEIGGPGAIVVLTHFKDLDKQVYESADNKKAIMSIWHRIARDGAIKNVNPSYWEPVVKIDEEDKAIVMGVRSKLELDYKIYLNAMAKAEISLGTEFDLARSIRPDTELVQKSAEFAGFETLYNNANDENCDFGIHVLRYTG